MTRFLLWWRKLFLFYDILLSTYRMYKSRLNACFYCYIHSYKTLIVTSKTRRNNI